MFYWKQWDSNLGGRTWKLFTFHFFSFALCIFCCGYIWGTKLAILAWEDPFFSLHFVVFVLWLAHFKALLFFTSFEFESMGDDDTPLTYCLILWEIMGWGWGNKSYKRICTTTCKIAKKILVVQDKAIWRLFVLYTSRNNHLVQC